MAALNSEKQSKKPQGPGKGGARPGSGRPKGSLDKGNAAIRAMVVDALDGLGGVTYLRDVARTHPAAFLSLLGKILPTQIEGPDGGPVQTVTRIELVALSDSGKGRATS
jgi:hypothetical protein